MDNPKNDWLKNIKESLGLWFEKISKKKKRRVNEGVGKKNTENLHRDHKNNLENESVKENGKRKEREEGQKKKKKKSSEEWEFSSRVRAGLAAGNSEFHAMEKFVSRKRKTRRPSEEVP